MMDSLHTQLSQTFPSRTVSDVEVLQNDKACRVLQLSFTKGPPLYVRSFTHHRSLASGLRAMVEACLLDAEDLALALPYTLIREQLLRRCPQLERVEADRVVLVDGASSEERHASGAGCASSPKRPRPGNAIDGCLLSGDGAMAEVFGRELRSRSAEGLSDVPRTIYHGVLALHTIVSGHQNGASHASDTVARQWLMTVLTRLANAGERGKG